MKYLLVCSLFDHRVNKEFDSDEEAKQNIIESNYDWAIVIDDKGSIPIKYYKNTFFFFDRK